MAASGAVDSGLIPSRIQPMGLKLPFTASLLDVQHQTDTREQAGKFTVVPLRKAPGKIPILEW